MEHPPPRSPYRIYILTIIIFLFLGVLSFILNYVMVHRSDTPPVPAPVPVPAQTGSEMEKTGFSYALVGDIMYLKKAVSHYSNLEKSRDEVLEPPVFYFPDDENHEVVKTHLTDPSLYAWTNLISFITPSTFRFTTGADLFSFRPVPSTGNLLFALEFNEYTSVGPHIEGQYNSFSKDDLRLYFYNAAGKTLTEIRNPGNDPDLHYPKIGSISVDGKSAQIYLFPCWGCEGGETDSLLVNLRTLETKNIGWVSDFSWTGNGSFKYRERTQPDCPGFYPADPYSPCLNTGISPVFKTGNI